MDSTALASIAIGLGATIAAMVFPSQYPNAPKWLVSVMWWGGIVMILGGFGYLIYGLGMTKSVPKFEPLSLISIGLLIACGGVAWQYYKSFETAPQAPSETVNSQTLRHAPLTDEEKQFRLELRKFVISPLDDAYAKLQRVFGDLLQIDADKNRDGAHQHIRYFAMNSNDTGGANAISYIKSLAQVDINTMDDDSIQSAIVSFIENYYRVLQLHIWMFNTIAQIDIINLDSFKRWSESDWRCLTELRNLKSYHQAKAIKKVVETYMGGGRLWEKGG